MKKLMLAILVVALLCPVVLAQRTTRVKTHVRKNGTVVQGHRRTTPNNTRRDNWSTRGNVNPDTGKRGTKRP
jgi:hypothetical protein